MKEVENLRTTDPVLFGRRFALGDDLIRFCENGELRKLMDAVHGAQDGDILFYFAVKMFHKALINGHMMIASFLLDQGYPLHSTGIPNPLTEAIAVVEDFRAIAIIEFLVLGKNMDINIQVTKILINYEMTKKSPNVPLFLIRFRSFLLLLFF